MRDRVGEREYVEQPARVLIEVGRGRQVRHWSGVEAQFRAARRDQLAQRADGRVAAVVLVRGHDRLRGAGAGRDLGLGQALAAAEGSEELTGSHLPSISVCLYYKDPGEAIGQSIDRVRRK